jgi:hypothetical protein
LAHDKSGQLAKLAQAKYITGTELVVDGGLTVNCV